MRPRAISASLVTVDPDDPQQRWRTLWMNYIAVIPGPDASAPAPSAPCSRLSLAPAPPPGSEVGAGGGPPVLGAGREAPLAHLLELGPGRHLLGEERGLDALEQSLQPSHQLGLGNAQLALARHLLRAERGRH